MACNNAWANHRLIAACSRLSQTDFVAPRTSFFPTLKATLNHNLTVDWSYVDALERAFLTHDTRLTFLKDDPRLVGLRGEPRFAALIHKMKLDKFGPGLAPL